MQTSEFNNAHSDLRAVQMNTTGKPCVYYDGGCPLCRMEIDYYKSKDEINEIDWIDLTSCDQAMLGSDLNKQDALKRFHVRLPDKKLVSGGRAFTELWKVIPGFKFLGYLSQNRVTGWVLEVMYRIFLFIRPLMQKIMQRFG